MTIEKESISIIIMKNLKKYKFGKKVITIKLVRENNIEKDLNNERII